MTSLVPLLMVCVAMLFSAAPPTPPAVTLVYDADVVITPDSGWVEAQVTLRYPVPADDAHGVALLLNHGLTIRALGGARVRAHTLRPSEFSPSWNQLDVAFADAVLPGDTVAITLSYAGRPVMPDDGINRITPAWVELGIDSQWFPLVSTFAQDITGEVRLALPEAWTVVGSGAVSFENGRHVLRNHVAQVDVALIASPSLQRVRSASTEVYHRSMPNASVQAVLDVAAGCVQRLNHQFGAHAPFPVARLVLAERDGPGYSRKNYIVLSTVNVDALEALQQFVCHEVAHYWTRSPGSFSPDHWMSEAFAEYAAAMVVREQYGAEAFARLRARWDDTKSAPVWTPTSTQRPSYQSMYRRAPALLAQLEERLGEARFSQVITRYMVDGITSTAALLELVTSIGGAETADWFRTALAA